jgi:hypothetical protein
VSLLLRASLACGLSLAVSSTAHAQELDSPSWTRQSTREPDWELAGKAMYTAPPVRGGTSPFGAGYGGRLGFTAGNVYVGASVVNYLGETDVDVWSHALLVGGELGYSFRFDAFGGTSLVLRPQFGAGALTIFRTTPNASAASGTSSTVRARATVDVITTATGGTSSSSGSSGTLSGSSGAAATSTTTTVSNLYLQPGVTLMLTSAKTFAGVNASMLVVPALSYGGNDPTTWISYGLEGQLGVRF